MLLLEAIGTDVLVSEMNELLDIVGCYDSKATDREKAHWLDAVQRDIKKEG